MTVAVVSLYVLAAVAEIAGCFAFWAWARLGAPAWWLVPGFGALVLFAFVLTRIDVPLAGRAFAAYGGIYIACAMLWQWLVEFQRPDRWDLLGCALCLAGASIILGGPRSA